MRPAELLTAFWMAGIRRLILDCFAPDSCIASTAIGVAVLRELKLAARPLTCRLIGYNAAYVDWLDAQADRWGTMPTEEEARALLANGAQSIAVGFDDGRMEQTKWAGHLLLAVDPQEGFGYLVDLSADQANRPAKGIVIEGPQVLPIPATAWPGIARGETMAVSRREDGSALVYFIVPEDNSYEVAHDWKRRRRFRPLVGRIVQGMRLVHARKAVL
jgi:hypothetical protein